MQRTGRESKLCDKGRFVAGRSTALRYASEERANRKRVVAFRRIRLQRSGPVCGATQSHACRGENTPILQWWHEAMAARLLVRCSARLVGVVTHFCGIGG
ncbi:MAG: hypothetical protein JWM57_1297 [Phycisphaerales bacterium]|nr:hypothetical protein [Phycisphaerales bacterium]